MSELAKKMLDLCSRTSPDSADLAFSGGMDSLFLALCLRKFTSLHCIVSGTPLSEDLVNSRRLKDVFNLDLEVVELTSSLYTRLAQEVAPQLDDPTPMRLNLSVTMASVAERTWSDVLYMGHGADETFLGYHKYARLSGEKLQKEREKDLGRLYNDDLPVYQNIAKGHGIELRTPFLEQEITKLSTGEVGKIEIKEALRALGTPEDGIRIKKAMQFGSGSAKLLRGIAKFHGMSELALVTAFHNGTF